MLDWLWQGLLTNGLYALLVLLGGAALALLKKKGSRWFSPAVYFLVGCALVAITLYAFRAFTRVPNPPPPAPQITPENVEGNIRGWLDSFRYSVKKVDDPAFIFGLEATLDNGARVQIVRLKDFDRYVVLRSAMSMAPEQKAVFDRLTQDQQATLTVLLGAEMAKSKIGFSIEPLLSKITLVRRIPITANLTEGTFMQGLDEIDSAKLLAGHTLILELDKLSAAANPVNKPSNQK